MSRPKRIVVALALAWPAIAFALLPAPAGQPAAADAAQAQAAAAPTAAPLGDPNIARQIRDINERMMLLKAQLDEVSLQLQLDQKRAEKARMNGGTVAPGLNGSDQPPTVQSIEGIDRKLKAKLSFGNGLTQVVGKGETVNGWLISDITPSRVVLSHGKETLQLSFGAEPPPVGPQPPAGSNPAVRR